MVRAIFLISYPPSYKWLLVPTSQRIFYFLWFFLILCRTFYETYYLQLPHDHYTTLISLHYIPFYLIPWYSLSFQACYVPWRVCSSWRPHRPQGDLDTLHGVCYGLQVREKNTLYDAFWLLSCVKLRFEMQCVFYNCFNLALIIFS